MYPINQLETEGEITADLTPVRSATFKLSKSAKLIRLKSWEYWPFGVVYIPVFVYWLWLSLKARSFFFFSAANPSIESGGMLGESKIDILDLIDNSYKPVTVFIKRSISEALLSNRFFNANLTFPVIAKPNAGERGWGVKKIDTLAALQSYHQKSRVDYLIQEYVDYSLEFGVFYYRMPNQPKGTISSIVQKEFLSVTGNGQHNLGELILANDRAVLQWDLLKIKYAKSLHNVLPIGKKMTLVTIGNHCLGTKFLNANHLITPELTAIFDKISIGINGFYYGRYDLRCNNLDDFYQGKNIKIMELNGAGAEPAHIYDPEFSIWEGWKVLLHHWKVLYEISTLNHKNGTPYMRLSEARAIWKRIKADKLQNP
ncbi:D-alanine--D-alanine ligase [Dyadobacter beijingensis]|uniref:D-alanine--D-alanine ligase n=1 Tax=Dyadobacter beijingensis TaxID=365489 RepID=A0ABQ2HW34_9BACT|nr:D-alanine--D-alanine ligase [Dyadobacter beijingensis]